MSEKKRKTLFLPEWIIGHLDEEGGRYDGPGVVASAAVYAFCKANDAAKRAMLKDFRQAEIDHAYAGDLLDAGEARTIKRKQNRNHKSPKSAG